MTRPDRFPTTARALIAGAMLGPAWAPAMDPPAKTGAPPAAILPAKAETRMEPVLVVATAASGSDQIVQIDWDGKRTVLAGSGLGGIDHETVEDGPALEVRLLNVSNPVQAPDGTIYFAEQCRIGRIGPDRKVTTAAETEGFITALAVSPRDGSVVFGSQSTKGIWLVQRIKADGKTATLLGPGPSGHGWGQFPPPFRNRINSLAFTPEGDLLIAENGAPGRTGQGRIHRLRMGGTGTPNQLPFVPIAGGGSRPPSAAPGTFSMSDRVDLDAPRALAAAPDGVCYFVHCVRTGGKGTSLLQAFEPQVCRLDRTGAITVLAGRTGETKLETKGGPGPLAGPGWTPTAGGPDITQLRLLPGGWLAAVLETGQLALIGPTEVAPASGDTSSSSN
jgi:hypothetical protein